MSRSKAEVLQAIADLDEDAEALVEGPNLEREFRQRREDLLKELAVVEQWQKDQTEPRCGNCIYFVRDHEPFRAPSPHSGCCHRHAPTRSGQHAYSDWPDTRYDRWCGEWLGENPERILIGADKLEESGFLEAAGLLRMWYHKKPG